MHTVFMSRALELSLQGRYTCRPNPMVGAVIVEDGCIIAEGWHKRYGGSHAEIDALAKLSPDKDLSNCSMYVTLEPCSHFGKTPPCCRAVIEKKIGRVIVGARDPNPLVAGRGLEALRAAGIEVIEGVLKDECNKANEIFFKYISSKLPFITIKSALTLDGKIAADSGHSFWVSGEEARAHAQDLRAWNMGIMVGIGTVLADNPRLTCRLEDKPSPLRIIADSHLKIPIEAEILKGLDKAPVLIACLENVDKLKQKELVEKGVEILFCPEYQGHIALDYLFQELGKKGVDSVLVEGGGMLNNSILRQGLADKVVIYLAPKILGSGISFIRGAQTSLMDEALPLAYEKIMPLGKDIYIEALLLKE